MAEFAFDIYPANDPAGKISTSLTGARLARLTIDGELVQGEYKHVGHGLGEGSISIHTDHADATEVNFAKRNYVMFVRTDTEEQIGGFFLEEGDFLALSREERGGRILTYSGPGSIAYLDRYVLGHSTYATGSVARGDYNVPDQWTWSQEPWGAMLLRAVEEGQDHPDAFFAAIDTDFTRTRDSNNLLWDELGDYATPIGTSVLEMYADFLRFGLVAQMDAELSLQAYRDIDEFRTDRTSGTFAANKARFAAGVNILNDLPKRISPSQERTAVLIRGRDGDYVTIDQDLDGNPLGSEPYMAFLKSDTTANDATIVNMGKLHLTRRKNYSDQATVRHIIGAGTGQYAPGPSGDYWVLDLVTLHTGTAQHDFDEAPIEVASIRYFHDEAGNWFAETELGAQYIPPGLEKFQAGITSTIRQVRSLELCRAGQTVEAAGITLVDTASQGFSGGEAEMALPPVDDDDLLVVIGYREAGGPEIPVLPVGLGWTAMDAGYSSGGGVNNVAVRGAWKIRDGDTTTGEWTECHGLALAVFRGYDSADPIGVVGGSTEESPDLIRYASLTLEVTDGTSRIVTAAAALDGDLADTLSGSDLKEEFGPPAVPDDFGLYVTDAGVSSWGQRDLECSANDRGGQQYEIRAGASSVFPGAGREELVGTSTQAKRCDDTEHWHEVGSGSPTVNDDADIGFRVGTLWINDDNEMWLLTDNTVGAADWLGPLGSGGVDLSAINFLVGTASGDLSAEIVVGTTPGGQLNGTWASPNVDDSHGTTSPSVHHTENHAPRHSNGGADEVSAENLGTAENDTDLRLAPDGVGGVEFVAGGSSDPSADTFVWMPLTTVVAGDPVLVWDGDDSLIPDLVPV